MCLAILKPAKVSIPEECLRNGWIANPDGGGYAFVHKGKVVVRKGYTKLQDFLKDFNEDIKKYKSSPFVIHFRIRSMGDKTPENTHPFPITGGVMIHNGTLNGTGAIYQQGPSDTSLFAEKFKDHLNMRFVLDHKAELAEAIGRYNKFVFLYDNGQAAIVNEDSGVWRDDVWYSNYTFCSRPVSTYPSGTALDMMD